MTKAVLERALETEISDHLGYESGDPAGIGTGNSRDGKTTKSVEALQGPLEITVPRDRNGPSEPAIVPKRSKWFGKVEDMILSLYARGMTTRDIGAHMEEIYGTKVGATTISAATDVISDEVAQWQNRPLEGAYPIVYVDAVWLKIRDGGAVKNRACHTAVGVDLEGRKQVLGRWIADNQDAKFGSSVAVNHNPKVRIVPTLPASPGPATFNTDR